VVVAAETLLEASELYRFYHAGDEETFALRGVSLELSAGELVAIVGPSGSGKSTLLSCLAGLDDPDGGHVRIAGHRITRRPEPERAGLRARFIGILLQSGNLLEHLTLRDNVRLARAFNPKRGEGDVDRLLDRLGLRNRGNSRPSTLSGGESARAGLAVALANEPPILLADEPTGELDELNELRVLELLRGRLKDGGAVLVATHSERVAGAADRVIRLVDGKVADG
jgi:putative ABC transport system ATP-binding protein